MKPAGVECLGTGWCDYSAEHRRVREEAERLIKSYIEGRGDEYWMTVVVAPYGSGKTTLLKHLRAYAEGLGAKAALIEFADLVAFIVERRGSIHESELPRLVEEYVRERHGAEPGKPFVLLVDEIEESYDLFRGIVEHETSPLRGLAEAVRTHSTWVYPVLAFGPSSTLKEAVFGPVAWRSRVLTIPLIPKPVIAAMLRGLGEPYAELLANTVWWASKGRAAWVRLLAEELAPRLLEAAKQGPEKLEALLMGDELLTREILEGVPLFDRGGYRDVKRFVENKRLLPYLAAFVGPVPARLLEEWLGEPLVPEAGLVYGFTRSAVEGDELVAEATAWMERIARSKGFRSHSVEHAAAALEHVVRAWSRGGLLPYDPQGLRELFNVAADLAREMYGDDPAAAQLLESISPDLVTPEVHRLDEIIVYLRPSMLTRIYPSATNNPLIGCARRVGASQVLDVVESLTPQEVVEYSRRIASLLGLDEVLSRHGMRLLAVPARLVPALREEMCSQRTLVLVLDARGEEAAKQPPWLQALHRLGLAAVASPGPRVSLFLYSLIYNYALSTASCSLDKLEPHDRRLLSLYGDTVKSLAVDAIHEAARPLYAELEKRLERLAALNGEEALLAAAALAGADGKLLKEVGKHLDSARAAAERLAAAVAAPAPRFPRLDRLAGELARLRQEAPIEALPGDCTQRLPGRLGLLVSPPRVSEAPKVAPRLRSLAALLPEAGGVLASAREALEQLAVALEGLWRLSPAAGLAAEKAVEPLVETVAARLEKAAEAVARLMARVDSLPPGVEQRAREAVEADLARIGDLDTLLAYTGTAAEALSVIETYSSSNRLLEEIEKLKNTVSSMLDQFLETMGQPQAESGGQAAEATLG